MTSFMSKVYFEKMVQQGVYKEFKTEVPNITIFYHPEQLRVHVFRGRKKKPESYMYSTVADMLKSIDMFISKHFIKIKEKENQRDKNKRMAEEARSNIKVGDIFATSWGYEQTNVGFFEVVERISNAYVNVRQISSKILSEECMSATVAPNKGDYISEAKKCQINKYGHIVKADQYGHTAYKTDSESSHYVSWSH